MLGNVVSAAMGSGISAAITREGDLYCWGNNGPGQVGNGTAKDQSIPCRVLENVVSITLGGHSVAAVSKAGDLYCWGYNGHGQVGNGTRKNQASPVKVLSSVHMENSSSTDQDDSPEKNDDKDNETDSNIDLNIYKANRYLEKGTPSNNTVQSVKNLKYPSQILVDALNKDHGSFEKK